MAKPIEKTMTLAELVRASEASRLRLTEAHARVSHALDFPSRLKGSLLEKPAKWLGGSLAAGIAAGFLFKKSRHPEPRKHHGRVFSIFALAFTMGKPLAKAYALKLLKDYVQARLTEGNRERFGRRETPPY